MSALPRLAWPDLSAVHQAVDAFGVVLAFPNIPDELVDRIGGAIERFDELFTLETETRPAGGALNLVMVAKPSDALRDFLAAVLAGDVDLPAFEQAFRHLESSLASLSSVADPADIAGLPA